MKRSKLVISHADTVIDLREDHARLLHVIKALGGGIWDFDANSGVLWCNRRWHEILGLDYETQRVRSVEQFRAYIHPDDVDRATSVDLQELKRLIARDERYSIEFRVIHQDGSVRWLRSVASLIRGAKQAVRAVGCITDITSLIASEPKRSKTKSSDVASRSTTSKVSEASEERENVIALSEQEVECLRWVSFGKTAKETAVIIGKSPRTVEFHLKKAIKKLGAVNKVQAAFLAIQKNLLQ